MPLSARTEVFGNCSAAVDITVVADIAAVAVAVQVVAASAVVAAVSPRSRSAALLAAWQFLLAYSQ
jgi:hypothetical protein